MTRLGLGLRGSEVALGMMVAGCLVMPVAALAQTSPGSTQRDSATVVTPAPTPLDTAKVVPPATTPAVVTSPPAQPRQNAGMFSKGRKRVSVTGGWSHSLGEDYLLVGVGAGYFLANGLDVGVDFEGWFFGNPTVYKLSPRADYVMWKSPRMKPYVGGFFRRTFITGGAEDLNSLGGRAGVFYKGTRGGMVGAGAVYERYLNCDDTLYSSCDTFYPEIFFAVSF